MKSSDQILEEAARDGSIDIAEWPRVLESVLQKLHDIVHNDFPLPALPLPAPLPSSIDPEVVASTPPRLPTSDVAAKEEDLHDATAEDEPPISSQSSSKENDAPAANSIASNRPPVPGFEIIHNHQPAQPPDTVKTSPGTLPPDLLSLYQTSTHILEADFAHSPPYTIQRLAEMVLYPRKHYRFLPAYLRALDRIVSVSSPVSHFPLSTMNASAGASFLTNGDTNGIAEREGLGSDESLGGALLTPIPWLRNTTNHVAGGSGSGTPAGNGNGNGQDGELHTETTETILGPNGAGRVETVSVTVNGVSSTSTPSTGATNTTAQAAPNSPTLSEQSDATSSSSSAESTATSTEAQLRLQGGVTQGELLRQEQEAGVVPVSQASPRRPLISGGGASAVGRSAGIAQAVRDDGMVDGDMNMQEAGGVVREEEGPPHARGPEEVGVEDMGPQHHGPPGSGLDMEAAVGRSKSPPFQPQPPQEQQISLATQVSSSPPPPASASHVLSHVHDVRPAPIADAQAEAAEEDDAGRPGKDPGDVEKDVEMLKEVMDQEKEEVAKDEDGDVVVADADGEPVGENEKGEGGDGQGRGNGVVGVSAL